jgi:uncharacterized protein YsxB (DUF464 family)
MDLSEDAMKKAKDVVNSAQSTILSGGFAALELMNNQRQVWRRHFNGATDS